MKTSTLLKINASLCKLRKAGADFETRQVERDLIRLVARIKKATQRMERRSFLSEKNTESTGEALVDKPLEPTG